MAETNPYPPGSARAKLWERRQREKAEKAGKKKPAPKPAPDRDRVRNRRRKIDEIVDDAQRGRVERMRSNQSTDENN